MLRKVLGTASAALLVMALSVLAPAASASVVGHLDVANCPGGGVIVSATTIDWILPVGPPNGCVQTGSNTNITYAGGTLGAGATGSILDLTAPTTFPVTNFMTFTGATGLSFNLSLLGPGPTNTACAATLDPNAPACAAVAGSPFILQSTSTGTSVTLSARGTATDGSGTTSTWTGAYTTQISGLTPAQIQATIAAGGSEQSTFSGDFIINVTSAVPEPATVGSMLLGGLLLAGASLRRKLVR